jgi:serine/threonine-protein kinase
VTVGAGSEDNRVGDVLASKYKLEELLGSGGMGHVYRAVNQLVGRSVAIKTLRKEHASNELIRERFLREARAANLVSHPNVVNVLDIGDDGGTPFIVQELLRGEDLGNYAQRNGGKLKLEEVVDLLCPVIDAVAEAHNKGVVHRDIKPDNVFLARDGKKIVPKLLDFGISKVRSSDMKQTEVGMLMGTPAYMPPELLQGARDADARSDVWAFGVMLFQLIAGRLPFEASDAPRLFVAIATTNAPRLVDVDPTVPVDVSLVIERCLRRLPDERYPTAAELARDLRHCIEGDAVEPTGKRSLPPDMIPDLAVPKASMPAPYAPTIDTRVIPNKAQPVANPVKVIATPDKAFVPASAKASPESKPLPKAPSLPPPTPKPTPAAAKPAAAKPAPAKPAAAKPAPAPAEEVRKPRLAAGEKLPGVVLAPGGSASTPSRRKPTAEDWGVRDPTPTADTSWIVGLGVVGLVAILTTGVLMQFARMEGGFAIGRFALGGVASSGIISLVQVVLGLVGMGIAATYGHRAVRHWRGELAGGRFGATLSAVLCGGAFFVAIELVRAAW